MVDGILGAVMRAVVVSVGTYLYLADGNNLYFTSTSLASGAPTWTTVTSCQNS